MKDDDALNGMQAIAEYMHVSRPTIHRWGKEYGFPMFNRGPGRNKRVFTTKFAIAMWVLSMTKRDIHFPTAGPPKL